MGGSSRRCLAGQSRSDERETENLCHVGEALAKFSFFLGAKVRLIPASKKGGSGTFHRVFGGKKVRCPVFEGKKGPFSRFVPEKEENLYNAATSLWTKGMAVVTMQPPAGNKGLQSTEVPPLCPFFSASAIEEARARRTRRRWRCGTRDRI